MTVRKNIDNTILEVNYINRVTRFNHNSKNHGCYNPLRTIPISLQTI